MSTFAAASAVSLLAPGRYGAHVPDGWQQGRGAFGGLVLGMLLRAMETEEADPSRRPRTLIGDIAGPVTVGPAELRVRVLRRGSNQSNLQAELWQEGEVRALASTVLSASRRVEHVSVAPPAPELSPWESVAALPPGPDGRPPFVSHYEYRPLPPYPFSGETGGVHGYIRESPAPSRLDAAAVIGLLDSYWPALLVTEPAPRPMSTVSFSAQLLGDPGALAAEVPLAYRAATVVARGGFVLETRELHQGGLLVATNQQTLAVIR